LPAEPPPCIAIGASTGGLGAIADLLRALPNTGAPILVSQHLPPVFIPFFIKQIEVASSRPVRIAENGLVPVPDEVIVARGDAHLELERDNRGTVRVRLGHAPSSSGCTPSVDSMFASAASVYGGGTVGIVLSGMGRDGLAGARRIVESGGAMLVQDRASSAVWGMPGAVAEAGLASAIRPPAGLARLVPAPSEPVGCR
jgi:two-component system chemotaxis response regulator CheB